MKQVTKGAGIKTRPSIKDIKGALKINDISCAKRPYEWIVMPDAFQKALKLPGFCMGTLNIIEGWSNTGKTTLKNCAIAACQRQGILPVIYETENNFDFDYAIACGMEAEPVMGKVEVEDYNEETGEVTGTHEEERIVDWEGEFIYFDSAMLAKRYGNNDYDSGKQTSKYRDVAVLEDIVFSMNEILDLQADGQIQQPICFFWDSVGTISGWKSFKSKTGNNMFDAGSISAAFNTLVSDRIPTSRRVDRPYTNTMVFVNKIWNNSLSTMGLPSYKLKGGETFTFGSRLIIHLGGTGQASIKKLNATAGGQTYNMGSQTKIKVVKNQLSVPYNLTYEGEICCLHNGIYSPDDLDNYKKTYAREFVKRMNEASKANVSEKDLNYTEEILDGKQ